jgi:YVTN family beta-propeller protein
MTRRIRYGVALLVLLTATPSCTNEPQVTKFPIEGRPSAVAATNGRIWITDDEHHSVHVLDADDGTEIGRPIRVERNPIAVTASGRAVWVAHASGWIVRIDAQTRRVAQRIEVGPSFTSIAVVRGIVWATDVTDGLYGIDPRDSGPEPEARRVPLGARLVPLEEGAVRVVFDGTSLWATGRENTVTRVDPSRPKNRKTFTVGLGPIGLAVDGNEVWVANSDDGTVSVLDGRTGRRRGTIAVGRGPVAVVVTGGGAFVANQDDATISRIDMGKRDVVGPALDVGAHPRNLAVAGQDVWAVGTNPSLAVRVEP